MHSPSHSLLRLVRRCATSAAVATTLLAPLRANAQSEPTHPDEFEITVTAEPPPAAPVVPRTVPLDPVEPPPDAANSHEVRDARGEVVSMSDSEVIITGENWRVGDHVEFVRVRNGGVDTIASGVDVLGVGEVRIVRGDRARVRVPLDTQVRAGDGAWLSAQSMPHLPTGAARAARTLTLAIDSRAFLPVGAPIGIGGVWGLEGTYRFGPPIALHAQIYPLGGVTSGPGGGAASLGAILTLDTRFFEAGIGLGFMTTYVTNYLYPYGAGTSFETAFMISQFVRIGSYDGVMLQAQTAVYAWNGQFEFGAAHFLFRTPIAETWWLDFRGGANVNSYGVGEVGLRHLMLGNGLHGTLFITGYIGGIGIATAQSYGYGSSLTAGPSIGIGFEGRI
jgi:hypothetical protein